MDFKSVNEQRDELTRELIRLKGDPLAIANVPSILKLVELEVTQLNKVLLTMGPKDMHVDVDGLEMIDRVSNELGLTDTLSAELLSNQLMKELNTMNLCFHPRLVYIANFILMVINRLDQKVSRDKIAQIRKDDASASNSREPKQASVDDSKSQVVGGSSSSEPVKSADKIEGQGSGSFPQPDDTSARRNLEWSIDVAIWAKMQANPQDFGFDQVIELLQRYSQFLNVNVDDENVRRLIIEKCDAAIESRDKKLADQGNNQGKSG